MSYFRCPKTRQEMAENATLKQEVRFYLNVPVKARKRQLPDSWSDIQREYFIKTWKEYRSTQYRPC